MTAQDDREEQARRRRVDRFINELADRALRATAMVTVYLPGDEPPPGSPPPRSLPRWQDDDHEVRVSER